LPNNLPKVQSFPLLFDADEKSGEIIWQKPLKITALCADPRGRPLKTHCFLAPYRVAVAIAKLQEF